MTETVIPPTSKADALPEPKGATVYLRYAPFVGGLLLAPVFLLSGVTKIGAYEATQGYMQAFGLPGALLPIVIAFEILAACALIIGYRPRVTASLLAVFTLLTAAIFHSDFADQNQVTHFLKNLAIAGGLLMVIGFGRGPLSLSSTSRTR